MKEQIAVQKLIRRKLSELQVRNPAFSIRAFANRLGLHASAANEILKGERRISRKMAEKLAARLNLDPSERAELLGYFPDRTKRTLKDKEIEKHVLRLTNDQFTAISDWVHFAILSLVKTVGGAGSPSVMAKRLGVTETKITTSIECLERLGLLKKDEKGKWTRTYQKINTTDDLFSLSIQKSHLNDMELARESLLSHAVHMRDFSSMTMAISPKLLPKAKEIIRRAQDEIASLSGEVPATEVYRLTSGFFPLTKIERTTKPRSEP